MFIHVLWGLPTNSLNGYQEEFQARLTWQKVHLGIHCSSSISFHLFHYQGPPAAGKWEQFTQEPHVVKSHKKPPSIPYPICFVSARVSEHVPEI